MNAHSFTAGADYRLYAATMPGFSGGSTGALSDIIASDDTIAVEVDDENGAIGSASNIAGTVLPRAGTCYVKARQFNPASLPGAICLYDFYVRVLSGSPTPAMDPNDEGVPPAPRSNGWRCRVIELTTAKDDTFVITVNESDTIGVIVGVDLERGVPEWNVIAGIGVFTGSFIITL